MTNPLVSIIIPTYNRADLIGETLDSILDQTYQNWECIVVDDGSVDETEELLYSYTIKDNRFQYHKRPDTYLPGGNGARNYGFELSQGDYVNWLDSDDLFSSRKLEVQIKQLLKIDADVALCKWGYFKDNKKEEFKLNNKLSKYKINNGIDVFDYYGLEQTFLPNHNFLIKRLIVIRSGLWNMNLTVNQDGEFFSRVLINAHKIAYVDSSECFVLYRKVTGQKARISTEKKAAELFFSWKLIQTQLLMAGVSPTHPFFKFYKRAIIKKSFQFKQVLPKDRDYYRILFENTFKTAKKGVFKLKIKQ